MNCSICDQPIVLIPSAEERARKYGETPAFYTKLFSTHVDCAIRRRREETSELLRLRAQMDYIRL
jgi:hypothetical protein